MDSASKRVQAGIAAFTSAPLQALTSAPCAKVGVAAHVVVEHRDVARRLIRDDDVVSVLMELVEHPAHRDDVVVRVRGEDDHALPRRELAATADLGDQGVENRAVQRTGLAIAREQRAQVVLAVIILVELED